MIDFNESPAAQLARLQGLEHEPRYLTDPNPAPAQPKPMEYDAVCGQPLLELKSRLMRPIDAAPTMWPMWNQACRGAGGRIGLARGWHILLGAKSGMGKSLAACNVAAHCALSGEKVTFHTLEMSWDETVLRTLAIATGTDISRLEQGPYFDGRAFDAASKRMNEIREANGGLIHINRDPLSKLTQICEGIRRGFEVRGSRVHIIDYLQLAWTGSGKLDEIFARVTEISHAVRGLAKELKVVTVGLSQFARETTRANERPRKEGLMGGSPLENDAEQTLLLDHSRQVYDEHGWKGWALLDKNRHGPSGIKQDIPIHVCNRTLRMRERLDDEVEANERADYAAPAAGRKHRKEDR